MRLVVQISKVNNGCYRACCPALPGCAVVAQTQREAHEKITTAVEGYIASLDVTLPRELERKHAEALAS